ncbi:MAG: hypothetical protein M3162_08380 [Thermoproteota archaeon]|nr:hypothetical protein [Thermoproteota archaeon]
MDKYPFFSNKTLFCGFLIALVAGISFGIDNIMLTESSKAMAQQQQQQQQQQQTQQNQSSVPHDAKGHESHQVIVFQNSSDGIRYSGTVTFNLSKPADVISFEDITGKQPPPPPNTTKVWEVGSKQFVPKTLLKNVTSGSVNFEGSGIMAHNTQSEPYNSIFTMNSRTSNSSNVQ